MEISLRKNKQQVATAIAIAGRSCRPCDVCGRDQARWFCAADEAYLCGQCDGSVHGANAVASKHERTLLGPGGLPSLKLPSAMASTYCHRSKKHSVSGSSAFGSRKKPRSIRHHSHTTVANSSAEIRTKATSNVVKNEPDSPETSPTIASLKLENEFSAHEVPIFLPSEPELLLPAFHCDCSNSFMMNAISSDRIATEEAETGLKYAIKGLLESRLEQRSREEEMQMSTSDDELTVVDEMGLFGMCDESLVNADYGLDFSSIEAFEDWKNASEGEVAEAMEAVDHVSGLNDGLSWRVKMEEVEDDDEAEKLKLEVDELLACALITGFKEEHEEEEAEAMERKVSLKLDYEDVLSAWSDRGSLWTDGRRPQIVPEDCEFDTARSLDIGLVPDLNFCSTTVVQQQYIGLEQVGLVPVTNMGDQDTLTANCGREARVMRYREKRRTRLFSKKIRYEVRKLNAEMRPRWKGRFVKRSAGLS